MADHDDTLTRIARELFILSFLGFDAAAPEERQGTLVTTLASRMQDLSVKAGEVVFREGDASDYLFFMIDGEVRLTREGAPPWTLEGRSILGALDATQGRAYTRTATAVTDAHLLQLPAEVWFDVLEDDFEAARTGIRNMARGTHALVAALGSDGGFVDLGPDVPAAPAFHRPMTLIERILVLRKTRPFAHAHMQTVTLLAEAAEETDYAAGEEVFDHADAHGAYHVVAAGQVEATREEPRFRARFGPSTLLCATATLAGELALYAARAVVPATILRIRREDVFDVMEEHVDLTRATFRLLSSERERLLDRLGRRATQSAERT